MKVADAESSGDMEPDTGQLLWSGSVRDHDVDGLVLESGEPVFVGRGQSGDSRSMLGKDGDPALLIHAHRTVMEHDDVAAVPLPSARRDLGPNCIVVVAELT